MSGGSRVQTLSIWIYGIGLITVFAASAAYNVWPVCATQLLLRRFDQAAIFLFIAASYTPFLAWGEHAAGSENILIAIWTAASFGVLLKLAFPGRFERLSILLCFALGWSGMLVYDVVFAGLPAPTIGLVIGGGVLYSAGVPFHLHDRLRFQNAIWHAFVMGAAALQFFAVFNLVSVFGAANGGPSAALS